MRRQNNGLWLQSWPPTGDEAATMRQRGNPVYATTLILGIGNTHRGDEEIGSEDGA